MEKVFMEVGKKYVVNDNVLKHREDVHKYLGEECICVYFEGWRARVRFLDPGMQQLQLSETTNGQGWNFGLGDNPFTLIEEE